MSSNRLSEAKSVIKKCATQNGFRSGDGYGCYLRDLCYSMPVLLELGYADTVRSHLLNILKRQKPSGELPTEIKNFKDIMNRIRPSVISNHWNYWGWRIFSKSLNYLSDFQSFTTDTPMLFLSGVAQYEKYTGDRFFSKNYSEQLNKIVEFIDSIKDANGMMKGMGWFDAMDNYKENTTFHSQTLLHKMYSDIGEKEKANEVKDLIARFWDDELGYYVDYLGSNRFDVLSHAIAINEGAVPEDSMEDVLKMFSRVLTSHGYPNIDRAYPKDVCGQTPNAYQNYAIWPFHEYEVAKAFDKLGMENEVRNILSIMNKRKGFNEWYSAIDGSPNGAKNQLWSACAYIGVSNLLQ